MASVEHRADEEERIYAWRLEVLLEAGFAHGDAEAIARELDADLHVATALVEGGCPPETARRILI
jgi:hypothetical protein